MTSSVAVEDHKCNHCATHHELRVENLSVSYKNILALDQIHFNTRCGERLALVGANGAGKSTLLKSLAGLLPYQNGKIIWRGKQIRKWSHEIAYLPQREEVNWDFPLTVRNLVEMGRYPQLGWWRKWRKQDQDMVDSALQILNLEELSQRQISQLSGGQQQRAFLARAVAQEAHVLLLDEPFTGLDQNAARNLAELLATLAKEGRLIIASHHDLTTVNTLFDQVLALKTKQLAFGAVEQVWNADLKQQTFSTTNFSDK